VQEMNYEGGYHDEPPVSPAYQGVPPPLYNTYSSGPSGQKLTGFAQSNIPGSKPSATQRLVLAIISLILWMGMFVFVTFGVATAFSSGHAVAIVVSALLILGMLVFTGLVIFINAMFSFNKR